MKSSLARYHVVAWAFYISYEAGLQAFYGSLSSPGKLFFFYATEILLFYMGIVLFPWINKKFNGGRRTVLLGAAFLGLMILFILTKMGIRLLLDGWEQRVATAEQMQKYLVSSMFRGTYTLAFSITYCLIQHGFQKKRQLDQVQLERGEEKIRVAELETKLVKSENAWLRSRINPHLLFNTLNFLYSRFNNDKEARRGLELLIEIMRFSMGKPDKDGRVSIMKEWQQIENFIALQQIRFSYPNNINTVFVNGNPAIRIPPVILLTLVENIYKHGNLTNAECPAEVKLITGEDGWIFGLFNRIRTSSASIPSEHLGIGNVRTRLSKAYGDKGFTITERKDNDKYWLELKVHETVSAEPSFSDKS
jgi:two-component system LytT family sensor kinase